MPRFLGPAIGAAAAVVFGASVSARMQTEYESTETLQPVTVALLYSAYAANSAAFAWAARRHALPLPLRRRPAQVAGGALAAAAAGVAIAGAGLFSSGAQISGIESGSLVISGFYRYTRNPQYLGLVAGLLGIAVAVRSGLAALIAVTVWRAFDRWIPSEERHLERIFGEQYRAYAAQTRRWI
jgi:protein-S-isoprenylcysteine O-methyltransferase Ste14